MGEMLEIEWLGDFSLVDEACPTRSVKKCQHEFPSILSPADGILPCFAVPTPHESCSPARSRRSSDASGQSTLLEFNLLFWRLINREPFARRPWAKLLGRSDGECRLPDKDCASREKRDIDMSTDPLGDPMGDVRRLKLFTVGIVGPLLLR